MADEHLHVEGALSAKQLKIRMIAGVTSVIVGVLLMGVKFWAHALTGSQAIFSDAMESIVNVLTALLTLFVVRVGSKPADRDHPYGHGKVEYFSSAFEGGLITFAGFFIVVEAILAVIRGQHLMNYDQGMILIAGAGFGNLILGFFLYQVGQRNHSIALRANGWHIMTDFITTLGVMVGFALAWVTGLFWLDSLLAATVGLWLSYTGIKLVKPSIGGLMDEEDVGVLKKLAEVFDQQADAGIIQVHNVKTVRSGWFHHIDAHVVLPEFWSVLKVHEQMTSFEEKVFTEYPFSGEMNFHTDPCRRAYCRVCELEDCPVREQAFEKRLKIKLEDLRSPEEPDKYR